MCASTNMRNEVVFGGSDHALYSIDIADSRKHQVQLYSKKFGHTDWVTSCAHLRDGRLISAAMDCRLLLWSTDRRTCLELSAGHDKSISRVVTDSRYNIALSCGYDCQAAVWSFAATPSGAAAARQTVLISPTSYLTGASDPILDCIFMDNIGVCVCRDGSVLMYDMTSCQCMREYRGHSGQVTALDAMRVVTDEDGSGGASACFATGGADGYVRVWDARVRTGAVMESRPHVSKVPAASTSSTSMAKSSTSRSSVSGSKSKAVTASSASSSSAVPSTQMRAATVSCLCNISSRGSASGASTYLVSGGSDNRVCVLDIRQQLHKVVAYEHSKVGLYSLCVAGDSCVLAGDGSGMVYCYDTSISTNSGSDPYAAIDTANGALKYGLQASSAGAVRNIVCVGGKIVTGCEDGKAIVYSY
jgi:WD40 repeat protein